MRNVSAKYLQAMESRRDFYPEAEVTFLDGVKKTLTKDDFCISGNSIIDSAECSSFPLGILVSKRITLTIINDEEQWKDYSFTWAKIFLKTKFDLDDGTTETLNIGTFTVVTPESYGSAIQITAMDDCYKTDVDYSTNLEYPLSAGAALKDSCDTCGITLQTLSFPNDNFIIESQPENLTHRQFIGLIAMIAGGNAKMDEYNRLIIKPYDFQTFEQAGLDGGIFDDGTPQYETGDTASGGSFSPWDSGDNADGGAFGDRNTLQLLYDYMSGIKIEADDVVITGIQMVDENKEVYLYGKEGYILQVENVLATGKEAEVVALIGEKIVGIRFRPFSGDHIAYPLAEFMDMAYIFDYKSNMYQTVLTNVSFTYNGYTTMQCTAESPVRNSSKYYGAEVKAIIEARKMVKDERTERERALETLANELAHSSGLYITPDVQPDGSTIYYMHDKPTLGESKIVWKLTAEAIGISTDGGKTYPVGVDATGMAILNRIYTIGLNADYITTGAFEIRRDGKVMVLMDKDTGEVILRPDTFELSSGATIDSIAEGKANAAANDALDSAKGYTDNAVNNFVSKTYDPKIADLQKQLDGQIESFYYDHAPELTNEPASNWKTDTDKQKHEGDLFYNRTTGYAYRFYKEGTTWKWQMIQDTDITKAIQDAAAAQDTADHKRRVFVSTPKPPYDIGDLWVQGANGDIMRCQTNRTSGAYASGDWVKASKYTDDSALKTFINDTYTVKINELETQADKKAETWYQTTDPSKSWSDAEKAEHTGDLWYNSTASVQKYYRWDGSDWQELTSTPPDAVFDQIDGKAQIFINTPTAPYHIGDLWFNSATSDIMTCIKERTFGSFLQSEWEKRNKYTDNTELTNFIKNTYEKEISALEQQADKKAETWYQATNPAGSWTAEQKTEHKGDLWYNTSDQKTYIYNGTGWSETKTTPPQEVFDKIDGKAQIFIDTPKPPYHEGDLWFQSNASDIMTCTKERLEGNYNSGDWQKRNKYIDQSVANTAASNAVNAQTQQSIFNKLTNNGTEQGIYLREGLLYLNAEYMATGVLQSHDGETFWLDLDNGVLKMKATELTIAGQSVNQALSDAVTSIEQQYYLSTSSQYLNGGKWDSKQPAWTQGSYLWNRQYVTYGNGETAYLPSDTGVCITGNTGANGTNGTNGTNGKDGANGENGISVKSVVAQYVTNQSTTEVPGTSAAWSETMPTVSDGYYIWCRQKITYSSGGPTYTTPYCMSKTVGDIAQQKVDAQSQKDIFDKLTNKGEVQGIYLENGKLYLNAEYMSTGILADKAGKNFWNLNTGQFSLSPNVLENAGNLLMDSDGLSSTYWQYSGTVTRGQSDPDGGTNAIRLTPTNNDGFFSAHPTTNKPIKSVGQAYTFSVWLKASRTTSFTISLNHTNGTRENISVGTTWKRYTITTDVTSITTANQVTIGGWGSLTSSSGNIYIYKPVVEYGYDSDTVFNQLTDNGKIQGLFMEGGKLYINGSNIKTDYLSAISANLGAITTGVLQSSNYSYTSGNFANAGMQIDLNNKRIRTPGLYINCNTGGTAYFTGDINASSITAEKYYRIYSSSADDGIIFARTYYDSSWGSVYGFRTGLLPVNTKINNPCYISFRCDSYGTNSMYLVADTIYAQNHDLSTKSTLSANLDGHATTANYADKAKYLVASGNTNIPVVEATLNQVSPAYDGSNIGVDQVSLGASGSGHRWNNIYAKNTTIQTSDRRVKDIVSDFTEANESVFMDLKPILYKFKNVSGEKRHDRVHYGFIAQEVEESLNKYGISDNNCALLCKDDVHEEDANGNIINSYEKYGIEDYIYSLRPTEFIPWNTHMIQKALRHQAEQDAIIARLEAQIEALTQ